MVTRNNNNTYEVIIQLVTLERMLIFAENQEGSRLRSTVGCVLLLLKQSVKILSFNNADIHILLLEAIT